MNRQPDAVVAERKTWASGCQATNRRARDPGWTPILRQGHRHI